jgi:hypothetical protein
VTIEVFSGFDPRLDWTVTPIYPVEIHSFAPNGTEQRAAHQSRTRYLYVWPMDLTRSLRDDLVEFLTARGWEVESFFLREPLNGIYSRSSISIGTGDGSETEFTIPSTGENAGDYPIDDAHAIVYVSGSPVTVSAVNTEDRSFTLASPPAGSAPVTADYWFYRLVRLVEKPDIVSVGPDFFYCRAEFLEVPA